MKKNKRKIKVPAAAYGLGQATTAEMAGLSGLYNSNSIASGQLPTPSMPNVAVQPKAPAMGGGFGGAMQMLPDAIDLVSNPFKKSTATSGKDAAMQSVANIGKGAAMGAMVGGPVGAIVGAGIGAIGSGGEKASMDNFVAYNEGTLGTGLIGAFGNKGLRKERDRIKTNAYNNRAAVQGTNDLENRYELEHGDMQVYSAAKGGQIPSSLAYVDDGELIQTPNIPTMAKGGQMPTSLDYIDGNITKIPERGQPVDSNLVEIPEGSKVLSNTLKVPGTKDTFSQLGEKLMAKRVSKGKDRFAENANKLNQMNNKMIYDQLFEVQEQVKAKKGIKNKSKNIESFAGGGVKLKRSNLKNGATLLLTEDTPNITRYDSPIGPQPFTSSQMNYVVDPATYMNYASKSTQAPTTSASARTTTSRTRRATPTRQSDFSLLTIDDPVLDNSYELEATPQDIKPGFVPISRTGEVPEFTPKRGLSDYASEALTDITALAPALSNMFAKGAERVDATYNPYAGAINRTMRGRRFNVNPAIEDINRNRAISNYNVGQMNTNTGANLAYSLQSAVNSDRAISNLRAQESNVNNQYAGEYAEVMNNLGQQWVGATNLANETNAQNRAAARNMRRTGMSQVSQWAQNRQQMRNQRNRDNAMLALYKPFLEAGYSTDVLNNVYNTYVKGGNRYGR